MDTKPAQNKGVARRVLIGGLWAGSLCWFARDVPRLLGTTVSDDDGEKFLAINPPFEHHAEKTHLVAMVGEPVICDVVLLRREPQSPISYKTEHSVSVTTKGGDPVSRFVGQNHSTYQGNTGLGFMDSDTRRVGNHLSYTVSRVFDLSKPGSYEITVHLHMPWQRISPDDLRQQQEYQRDMRQWQGGGNIPTLPVSRSPKHSYRASVTVDLTLLPSNQKLLMKSARLATRAMISSLMNIGRSGSFHEQDRKIELFWGHTDSALIPVAKEELLPLKRLLKQHAANTEPLFNGAGSLRGEARTVVNALDSMLSTSECPPLSPARQELVLWLTEEARNGKNHALRRMVQSSVDDAPRPV